MLSFSDSFGPDFPSLTSRTLYVSHTLAGNFPASTSAHRIRAGHFVEVLRVGEGTDLDSGTKYPDLPTSENDRQFNGSWSKSIEIHIK
jgi:hypothetical protein